MADQIRAIIFDMGQVLLKFTPDRILSPWFPRAEKRRRMIERIFQSGDWALTDTGRFRDEEILARWIAACPEDEAPLRGLMARWHEAMEPVEGMTELVRELKAAGYRCYLLSNTSMRFYDYCDRYDCLRLLDGWLISAEKRLVKPDPAIFRALLETFSLSAEECFFVDDAEKNIMGARDVGIEGFCFTDYDVAALRRALRAAGVRVAP